MAVSEGEIIKLKKKLTLRVEEFEKQGQDISYKGEIVESQKSGDLAVFYLTKDWNIEGFI